MSNQYRISNYKKNKNNKNYYSKNKNKNSNNNKNNNSNILSVQYVEEYSCVSLTISHDNFNIKNTKNIKNNFKNNQKTNYQQLNNQKINNYFKITYKQQNRYMVIKNTFNNDLIYMNLKAFNYFGKDYIKPLFTELSFNMRKNKISKFNKLWNIIENTIKNLNGNCDSNKGYLKPEYLINNYVNKIRNNIIFYSK